MNIITQFCWFLSDFPVGSAFPQKANVQNLLGAGPFTVFVPVENPDNLKSVSERISTDPLANTPNVDLKGVGDGEQRFSTPRPPPVESETFVCLQQEDWRDLARLDDLVRYHIVSCEMLRLSDLQSTQLAVSTSGHTLRFSQQQVSSARAESLHLGGPPSTVSFQGSVWINNSSRIVESDYVTSDGVIHRVSSLLTPYSLRGKAAHQPNKVGLLGWRTGAGLHPSNDSSAPRLCADEPHLSS